MEYNTFIGMYSRLRYFHMAELLKTYYTEIATLHSSIQYNSSLTETGETSDYQIEFPRWVDKKVNSDNSQSSMPDEMAEMISVHPDGSENSMDQDVDIDDDLPLDLSMRSLEPDQSLTPSRMSPDVGQDFNNLYWAASGSSTSSSYTNENWTLKYQQHSPRLIELLPDTGVYIGKKELDDCLKSAKNCTQLTRLLTKKIFSESALRKCKYIGTGSDQLDLRLSSKGTAAIIEFVPLYGYRLNWRISSPDSIKKAMRYQLKLYQQKQ